MSNFEFVLSLVVILLGLGLAEVLGGLARIMRQRPRPTIGWATGLLATWTITETILFWRVIWRARDALPSTSPSLFAGFAISALYYFAGALVFPHHLEGVTSLNPYFDREYKKVVAALLAANTLAYLLRPLVMGSASWAYMQWFDYASLVLLTGAAIVALVTKRRNIAIACLAVDVLIDLLDPVEAIMWPN
jgi:hypothetical protein